MIVAKPVVDGKYWIIKNGDLKIGEVEKQGKVFEVKIGNEVTTHRSIGTITDHYDVRFETDTRVYRGDSNSHMGYPTNCKPYNTAYSVRHKLPLFAKTHNSRSLYAAGWYKIRRDGVEEWELCPKLIFLQRYPYDGPYKEKQ